MTERRHDAAAVFAWVVALFVFVLVPSAPASGADAVVRTVEPPPTSTEPTTPETTLPETTEPAPVEPEDDSDLTAVTIIGMAGFAILVGLAAWWMVSRRDEDDAPHPLQPGVDEPLPGQDLL